MGSGMIDLTSLDLGRPTDISVVLQDVNKPSAQLGEILLTATLFPKTQEDKEQVKQSFWFMMSFTSVKVVQTPKKGFYVDCVNVYHLYLLFTLSTPPSLKGNTAYYFIYQPYRRMNVPLPLSQIVYCKKCLRKYERDSARINPFLVDLNRPCGAIILNNQICVKLL